MQAERIGEDPCGGREHGMFEEDHCGWNAALDREEACYNMNLRSSRATAPRALLTTWRIFILILRVMESPGES